MKMKTTSLCLAMALLPLYASAFNLNVDFQDDTPGEFTTTPPVPTFIGTGQSFVVGDETTVKDPFGITGNQSLLIWNNVSGGTPPRVTWELPSVTAGVLTFDVYFDPGESQSPVPSWRLFFYDEKVGDWEFSIGARGTRLVKVGDAGEDKDYSLSNQYRTVFSYRIEFAESGWSAWIDDVLVEIDGESVFGFRNETPTISNMQFVPGGNGNTDVKLFIDNISMIPEPGHYALIASAFCMGIMVWYRRRRN